MDLEKLKETLKANGVEEDKIDKIIADLAEEDDKDSNQNANNDDKKVDENQVDGKTEEDVPPTPTDNVPPASDSNEHSESNSNEEGVVPQEGAVPPVPPEDGGLPPQDVPPSDATPSEVPPVPAPTFDPTELLGKIDELANKNGEYEKTIEGLIAKVDSLEEALKNAGVLEKDTNSNVGIDESRVPQSGSVGADSAFVSALNKLNRKY